MKARIQKNTADGNNVLLSIGIIVKNEEKYLASCLDALKPLLMGVRCELVIVDTGSADRTRDIALKYTDKLYHFDWVNDFSAARNYCLEQCTGEWFMFLDADEVFDDLREMLLFFSDQNALNKFNSATYMRRDYSNPDGSEWTNFTVHRIVKRFEGLHFINPIHEGFNEFPGPQADLRTFVHHWGYAFENEAQAQSKKQRNLTLLYKELERKPDDLRIYLQILNDLEAKERARLLPEVFEKARAQTDNPWSAVVFTRVIIYHYRRGETDKSLGYIHEYFELFGAQPENVLLLELYVIMGDILQLQEKYDEALGAFDNYFKRYKLYTAGRLSTLGFGAMPFEYCDADGYEMVRNAYDAVVQKKNASKNAGEVVLSIGMIVRNEEQYLPACLDALKPLRERINCELVIVDTGSEDRTLQIALGHTNKLFHYEWADDFSAARNFGLEKCTGKWFMFLDADEIFGDLTDIINFLSDENLNRKYNSAYYVIHNYATPEHDTYLTQQALRIARRTPKLCFTGAIHEYLNAETPACFLNSYVRHYGYAYADPQARHAKDARNLALLEKELLDKPGDMRTITHILALSNVDFDRKHDLIQGVLSSVSDDVFSFALLHCASVVYAEAGEEDKALEVLDIAGKHAAPDNAILAEVYASKAVLLYRRRQYSEAIKYIEMYLEYYEKHEHGKLDMSVFSAVASNYLTPDSRDELKGTLALCAEALDAEETYSALKNNTDLSDKLTVMNREDIEAHLNLLSNSQPDLPRLAINYMDEQFYVAGIRHLMFGVLLFEAGLRTKKAELSDGERAELYAGYAKYAALYTANIYNPGLLNEDDIGVLPEGHRFGYYLTAAEKELEADNKVGYIRELKKALVSCKGMTNVIKFLLEEFTAKL